MKIILAVVILVSMGCATKAKHPMENCIYHGGGGWVCPVNGVYEPMNSLDKRQQVGVGSVFE